MVRLIAIAVLVIGGCCPARYSKTDLALEGTFAAELAVDGAQTRAIVDDCQEYNPVIGPCGQRVPYPAYILGALVIHAAISAVLPPRARTIWQSITVGVEAHTLYYNAIVPDQMKQ